MPGNLHEHRDSARPVIRTENGLIAFRRIGILVGPGPGIPMSKEENSSGGAGLERGNDICEVQLVAVITSCRERLQLNRIGVFLHLKLQVAQTGLVALRTRVPRAEVGLRLKKSEGLFA